MRIRFVLVIAFIMVNSIADAQTVTKHSSALELRAIIPMPNVKGRIDHMDVDLKTNRVFIAALENNTVEIVDLKQGKLLKSLSGFEEPQGVLFRPESNRLYITNGGAGTCSIIDAATLKIVKTIPHLEDADNIRYDTSTKLIFVAYGRGGIAAIDAARAEIAYSLPMTDHPESFQLETKGNRIVVNVPSEKKIVVFDKSERKAVATWFLKEAERNFPMAIDDHHGLLFVGCRTPARVLVLKATSGTVINSLSIGEDVDDIFYDAERRRLYVSCGEGVVDVFGQSTADKYTRIDRVQSRKGARTSLFIPSLKTLLVAGREEGREPAQLLVYSVVGP